MSDANETPLAERIREWALEKPWEYEPHFSAWMDQLTELSLYDKADIALVLAMQSAEIERLDKRARIAELKASTSLANNLCPDHRDKQVGRPCLACEIERLQAKLAEAQKDAGRYQWLRKQHWNEANMFVVAGGRSGVRLGTDCPSLARLDAAIDALRASKV